MKKYVLSVLGDMLGSWEFAGVSETGMVPVLMEFLFLWSRQPLKESLESPVEPYSQGI